MAKLVEPHILCPATYYLIQIGVAAMDILSDLEMAFQWLQLDLGAFFWRS